MNSSFYYWWHKIYLVRKEEMVDFLAGGILNVITGKSWKLKYKKWKERRKTSLVYKLKDTNLVVVLDLSFNLNNNIITNLKLKTFKIYC